MRQQRMLIALVLMASSTFMALAQELNRTVEVARVRAVIAELNKARMKYDGKAFSQLFARDGTVRIGREIVATGQAAIEKTVNKPVFWSETTAPTIEKESVRFVSPDVALVQAIQSQYGSLILKQNVAVTLFVKLVDNEWRIGSMWIDPAIDYPPRRLTRSNFLVE